MGTIVREAAMNGYSQPAQHDYLEAMLRGNKPEIRPIFGHLETEISELEKSYELAGCHGHASLAKLAIEGFLATGKYPGLTKLLKGETTSLIEIPAANPLCPPLPEQLQWPLVHPDTARNTSPWLDEYSAFSKRWSPRGYEDFHEAVGIWILSTVAARRVRLDFGGKEYTPFYIALVAHTTLHKKSTTAKIAYDLLGRAGLRWLLGADSTTPQKLLSDMAGRLPGNYRSMSEEDQQRVKQRIGMSGQRGWYYDEFGQHLDAMARENGVMSDFKGLLRRLDDCYDEYEYSTISRGSERIEKPYLSLLASMTPSDIKPYATRDAKFWKDGLFARFGFICPPVDDRRREWFPEGEIVYPMSLLMPLAAWHHRLGEPNVEVIEETNKRGEVTGHKAIRGELPEQSCVLLPGVKEAFYRYENALLDLAQQHQLFPLFGNYGRLPKQALRIAMLLASLENNGKIEIRHWSRAQEIAERWRQNLHEMYNQVNAVEETSQRKEIEDRLIFYVRKLTVEKQPPKARDIAKYMKHLDTPTIELRLRELSRAGVLEEIKTTKTWRYQYITAV